MPGLRLAIQSSSVRSPSNSGDNAGVGLQATSRAQNLISGRVPSNTIYSPRGPLGIYIYSLARVGILTHSLRLLLTPQLIQIDSSHGATLLYRRQTLPWDSKRTGCSLGMRSPETCYHFTGEGVAGDRTPGVGLHPQTEARSWQMTIEFVREVFE
jgi:hypothetical protein